MINMYKSAKEEITVKVVGYTVPTIEEAETPQDLISYCARVSNPSNQSNFDTAEGLLKYCIKHNHWSIFEMANVVLEIKAPRDISRQILRHSSNKFQEYSQRYAEAQNFVIRECRLQDEQNRQNSIDCSDEELNKWWEETQREILAIVQTRYKEALNKNIAKEVARVILTEGNTMSCLYMNGSVRSWLHYVDLREKNGTHKEHIWVAEKCREALKEVLPILF